MCRIVWTLISVAALGLAACSHGPDGAGTDGRAVAQVPSKVTGVVALHQGAPVPSADAKLVVSLVDVSSSEAPPLASKAITPVGPFPQSFELDFNPADVNPADIYVVKADLTDSQRRYVMALQAQVLTKDAPAKASIQLNAEQTPGEKQLAEFRNLQKQIGAMKISTGTKLDKDVSRGWQVFRAAGAVQMVRMLADYGSNGYASTDYAYKDGKPWLVEEQKKPSQDGKVTVIERAGWDADGNAVLKQVENAGKTDALPDEEAATLKQQAAEVLSLVTDGKSK